MGSSLKEASRGSGDDREIQGLLQMLNTVKQSDKVDKRIWKLEKTNMFSVASFFKALVNGR